MKNSKSAFIFSILVLAYILFMMELCFAQDFQLKDLYIEGDRAVGTNRHVYLPKGETRRGSLNLGMEIVNGPVYSKNIVSSMYTEKQFRHVSLYSEMGVRYKQVEGYINHYSGHIMDTTTDYKYPNTNGIGIRFNIVKDGE